MKRADAICKQTEPAIDKHLRAASRAAEREDIDQAAKLSNRASRVWRAMLNRIGDLPQPELDEATIYNWLGVQREQVRTFERAMRALRRGNDSNAFRAQLRIDNLERQADRMVRGWGFRHCT